MKKFSRLNLLDNTLPKDILGMVFKAFESKYVRLTIELQTTEYYRGEYIVEELCSLLEEEKHDFDLEDLINIIYNDLLKQIQYGHNPKELAEIFLKKQQAHYQYQYIEEFKELAPNHFQLRERRVKKKVDTVHFSIRVLRKHALAGELRLRDMYEECPELNLTLEDLIAISFHECMREVKNGNGEIVKNIFTRINNSKY